MAEAGYVNCSGCGRLFNEDSEYEMSLLNTHDCDYDEDELSGSYGGKWRKLRQLINTLIKGESK